MHVGWRMRSAHFRRFLPLLPLVFLAVAACATEYPQSTLIPKGDFAEMIDGVFYKTFWWALLVFVLVEGALVYVILRYRGKPGDAEPEQVHGNTTAEIIWTIIPALILAMIAVPTVQTIFKTYEQPQGDVVDVEVVGHQWWWEFRYPKYGVTTANELHVPVGKAVSLRMKTQDVLHSFWAPQFAAKRDVFPNRTTTLWFSARVAGDWSGACAEYCGEQHGRMDFHVVSESPEQFAAYMDGLVASGQPAPVPAAAAAAVGGLQVSTAGAQVAAQAPVAPAPVADPLVAQGKQLFAAKACSGCHSLDATKPMGVGPNLAKVGSRSYIAAGTLKNTDENLARWIQHPQSWKHGVLMPELGLTDAETKAIVAFLRTNK